MDDYFKVGDVVRVRDWDDMAAEYDGRHWNYISMPVASFIDDMRYLCGREFEIKTMGSVVERGVREVSGHGESWTVTTAMIEHVEDVVDCDGDISAFINLFGG